MCPKTSRRRSGREAFTLVEIMLVIALIALLTGVAIVSVDKTLLQGSEGTAKMFVRSTVSIPLTQYKIDMGSYPTTEEGLQALVAAGSTGADRWKGPYVKVPGGKLPDDPWGSSYQYRYPGTRNPTSYDVWSFGVDKKDGTADDIGNW